MLLELFQKLFGCILSRIIWVTEFRRLPIRCRFIFKNVLLIIREHLLGTFILALLTNLPLLLAFDQYYFILELYLYPFIVEIGLLWEKKMTWLLWLLKLKEGVIAQYLVMTLCTLRLRYYLALIIMIICCNTLLDNQFAYTTLGGLRLYVDTLIDWIVDVGAWCNRCDRLNTWQLEVVVSHEYNTLLRWACRRIEIIIIRMGGKKLFSEALSIVEKVELIGDNFFVGSFLSIGILLKRTCSKLGFRPGLHILPYSYIHKSSRWVMISWRLVNKKALASFPHFMLLLCQDWGCDIRIQLLYSQTTWSIWCTPQ